MPPPPRILFAYLGDPSASSRAVRQLRALAALNADVAVLGVGEVNDPNALPDEVVVQMLSRPEGQGPRWFWAVHRALQNEIRRQPAALYLASDLYVLPALAAAAERHGGALVFDSRELYGHLDASAGRPLVRATWQAVERRYIRRADAVLTVNDSIADVLASTYRIPRPTVLQNVSDRPSPPPSTRLQHELAIPDDGRLLVLYQGLFRDGRGLQGLLTAAREIDSVRLALIGEGPFEAEMREQALPLGERAIVHPFVHPTDLPDFTVGADLGACLIEPLTESLRLSLPNKLFEYLNAGVPVLASPLPEIQRIVKAFDVGTLADPADSGAIVEALHRASSPTARSSWRSHIPDALAHVSPTAVTARFQRVIQSLLPST